jgi:hypothetical protein
LEQYGGESARHAALYAEQVKSLMLTIIHQVDHSHFEILLVPPHSPSPPPSPSSPPTEFAAICPNYGEYEADSDLSASPYSWSFATTHHDHGQTTLPPFAANPTKLIIQNFMAIQGKFTLSSPHSMLISLIHSHYDYHYD